MAKGGNITAWILVAIVAVCLQVVFVFADGKHTATGTAVDFTKAYFFLDDDMEAYLCTQLVGDDDESATADYLIRMNAEARERGFEKGMVRQMIDHVETKTLSQNAESAVIHIEGSHRTCINPIYAYVAKLFRLGQTYTFEETLELVKEDGKWKVCGSPYGLSSKG